MFAKLKDSPAGGDLVLMSKVFGINLVASRKTCNGDSCTDTDICIVLLWSISSLMGIICLILDWLRGEGATAYY